MISVETKMVPVEFFIPHSYGTGEDIACRMERLLETSVFKGDVRKLRENAETCLVPGETYKIVVLKLLKRCPPEVCYKFLEARSAFGISPHDSFLILEQNPQLFLDLEPRISFRLDGLSKSIQRGGFEVTSIGRSIRDESRRLLETCPLSAFLERDDHLFYVCRN